MLCKRTVIIGDDRFMNIDGAPPRKAKVYYRFTKSIRKGTSTQFHRTSASITQGRKETVVLNAISHENYGSILHFCKRIAFYLAQTLNITII